MLYFKIQHTGRILRLRPIFSEVQWALLSHGICHQSQILPYSNILKKIPEILYTYTLLHILTKYTEKVVYHASFYFENYFSEI